MSPDAINPETPSIGSVIRRDEGAKNQLKGSEFVQDRHSSSERRLRLLAYCEKAKFAGKWSTLETLAGASERLDELAALIVKHFANRQRAISGKGMIA